MGLFLEKKSAEKRMPMKASNVKNVSSPPILASLWRKLDALNKNPRTGKAGTQSQKPKVKSWDDEVRSQTRITGQHCYRVASKRKRGRSNVPREPVDRNREIKLQRNKWSRRTMHRERRPECHRRTNRLTKTVRNGRRIKEPGSKMRRGMKKDSRGMGAKEKASQDSTSQDELGSRKSTRKRTAFSKLG